MRINRLFSLVCKVSKNVSALDPKLKVSSRSRENFGRSRSRLGLKVRSLGLGPQRLVYIPTFTFHLIPNLLAYLILHLVRCVNACAGNWWAASSSIESAVRIQSASFCIVQLYTILICSYTDCLPFTEGWFWLSFIIMPSQESWQLLEVGR